MIENKHGPLEEGLGDIIDDLLEDLERVKAELDKTAEKVGDLEKELNKQRKKAVKWRKRHSDVQEVMSRLAFSQLNQVTREEFRETQSELAQMGAKCKKQANRIAQLVRLQTEVETEKVDTLLKMASSLKSQLAVAAGNSCHKENETLCGEIWKISAGKDDLGSQPQPPNGRSALTATGTSASKCNASTTKQHTHAGKTPQNLKKTLEHLKKAIQVRQEKIESLEIELEVAQETIKSQDESSRSHASLKNQLQDKVTELRGLLN